MLDEIQPQHNEKRVNEFNFRTYVFIEPGKKLTEIYFNAFVNYQNQNILPNSQNNIIQLKLFLLVYNTFESLFENTNSIQQTDVFRLEKTRGCKKAVCIICLNVERTKF